MQIDRSLQYKLETSDWVTPIANQDGTVTLCCKPKIDSPHELQIQFNTRHIDSLERLLAMLWQEFEAGRKQQRESD